MTVGHYAKRQGGMEALSDTFIAETFILIGGLLLLGLLTDVLGRYTFLPRVTLLLLFGFLIGPVMLDVLPAPRVSWEPFVSSLALMMIGFLLGEKLCLSSLRKSGKRIINISLSAVIITAFIVFAGLTLLGFSIAVALLLAAIATATDPAATLDVVTESGQHNAFTETILGVVAIDDAWGLLAFGVLFAIAETIHVGTGANAILIHMLRDLGGAILLGVLLGLPLSWLSGRLRGGELNLVEALGMVLLCGGLAMWFEVSYLLSAVTLGAVVANVSRHRERSFRAISHIEHPFLILFFVPAGASLEPEVINGFGLLAAGYIGFRIVGRVLGGWLGCPRHLCPASMSRWIGWTLMPQAGVALGMALIVQQRMPELGELSMPVVIGSTVLFEIFGPIMTRYAIRQTANH